MSKETVVLVNGDSLKYSEAMELNQIAKERAMEFSLVGTVPAIPAAFYQLPSTTEEIDKELVEKTQNKLEALGRVLGVPKSQQKIIREHDKSFQELAKELNAQLIINGCDETLFEKVRNFIANKNLNDDTSKIPSIKVQEYLDIIHTLTKEKVKNETSDNLETQSSKRAKGLVAEHLNADSFSSLGGLFSWLSEQSQDTFSQQTLCKPGKCISDCDEYKTH